MATSKNNVTALGPRRRPSIRQKLRSLFKRKGSNLGTITPSPTRSSTDLGVAPNYARDVIRKQNRLSKIQDSRPKDLSIAKDSMGGDLLSKDLMGFELEEGGLEDLKMSFEKGDDAYTLKSPRTTLRSPLALSLELPEESESEEGTSHP